MKYFTRIAISVTLCLAMLLPVSATVSGEWREVSDEELIEQGLLLPDEELDAITAQKRKAMKEEAEKQGDTAKKQVDENAKSRIPVFITVNEKLNIDCKNQDVKELTEYLEANVKGFSSDLFKIELISKTSDLNESYAVFYGLQINGFQTPYGVSVFIENGNIKYHVSFTEAEYEKLMAMPMAFTEKSYEKEIEIAKKEAIEEIVTDLTVDYQEVTKVLNEDLVPMLWIQTVFVDDKGFYSATLYEYKLTGVDADSL